MNDVKVDSNDIEEMYIKYYTPLKRYCMKLVSLYCYCRGLRTGGFLSCGMPCR